MPRLPLVPTLIVGLAVAAMIGLGIWQLDRRAEKNAALAAVAANLTRSPMAFPPLGPVSSEALFRKSSAHCLRVVRWQIEAGAAADGTAGYRAIADCATGAEGPGVLVNLGVAPRPDVKPQWAGGQVEGWISEEPDHRPLIARLFGKAPPLRPMLIVQRPPVDGLRPAAPPKIEDVPNNHLAYAVQWFLFAGVAVIIYLLALRRKQGKDGVG